MNRILAAAVLLLATAGAWAGPKIQHWTAPSGARVYFVESRTVPIIDVQVDFSAGSALEPADKAGLASLARGLMDAGAGELDEERIAEKLADSGARIGGGADADRASVSLRTLASKPEREAALALMRTIMHQPTFPQAVLEREKARTIAAIKEADTKPDHIAGKRFAAALYGAHPYGVTPTVETVGAITRDDLVKFWQTHYSAKGASVAIVGDLSRAEAEAIAQQLTDGLPAGGAALVPPPVAMPKGEVVKIDHPATQAQIHLGLPALKRGDPDFFPLMVGNYVLGGGGFVSRLVKEVREKRGYAYSVYSYFQPKRDLGPFEIGLQTKREQSAEALDVVLATLDDFLAKGPSDAELKAAKRNMVDGFALRLDSNRKVLENVATIGHFGLPLDWLDQYPKRIEAVTAQQVREAFARKVKRENLVTVIVAGG